jgi:predicted AlkP superfamily pyrophosphatase or phosphodiesterase
MHKTVVINAVGLTHALLGPHSPRLNAFRDRHAGGGAGRGGGATIAEMLPAVTTSVQSTYLTGTLPRDHGIVGNGWYFRDEAEIKFWKQSNHLVQGQKLWDLARARDPMFTCANLCWWYAMYAGVDFTVTPRPMYPADGRKLPDIWTHPADVRQWLQKELGQFPLFKFWGPATSIESTQWIANAAVLVDQRVHPTLSLIYLPHLDYTLQKHGPASEKSAKEIRELDSVCGQLIDHFDREGARIIILSEYGMHAVNTPISINRVLRTNGLLTVREELGRELLDAGASAAFAVADHQIAHVYVNDSGRLHEVRALLESIPGIAKVLDATGKKEAGLDHGRSGDLIALAHPHAWFTYYYWLDDRRAPDFARTVDIHRKPGYDPVELFLDPAIRFPAIRIASILLRRKLGFRPLMALTPLDATLVRGSHGIPHTNPSEGPLLLTSAPSLLHSPLLHPTEISNLLLRHLTAPA